VQEKGPLRRRLPSSLLFLFVPTSFAWSGVVFAATGISVDLFVAIFCSITLMTAVMIRQVILIRDNRALEVDYKDTLADLKEKNDQIHKVSNQLVDRNLELESMQAELKNTILELERQRSVAIKNAEKAKHANEELRYMQLGLLDHLRKAESANKELEEVKAELMATNESMADANRMLLLASQTDGLTGLPNHRSIHESLADEIEWAQSKGDPVTLCLFDVDHFKSFNDTFGHLAGDDCLRLLAKIVRECLRGGDILGRYGGEEFAVIFRRTSLGEALFVAERIRSVIESTDFGHRKVTVSLGIASSDEVGESVNELIQAADEALYSSKRTGRNKTSIHMPQSDRKAA
jgi:diguanylate cyclase